MKQDIDSSRLGLGAEHTSADLPVKKRRLVNGKELKFRRPGDNSDENLRLDANEEATGQPDNSLQQSSSTSSLVSKDTPVVLETSRITIREDLSINISRARPSLKTLERSPSDRTFIKEVKSIIEGALSTEH
jgi:hypothetical protein